MQSGYERLILIVMLVTVLGVWVYRVAEKVLFFCFHYPGAEVIIVFYKMIRRDIIIAMLQ